MIQTTERVINRLFMRLASIYGHKWHSAYPTAEAVNVAKREWRSALERFDVVSIARGINHCRASVEWPPSLPEFIGYCQPDHGLPDVHTAYKEAANASHRVNEHEWSHPIVYHAARSIGFFDLKQKPEKQTRPLFEHAYVTLCRRIQNGEKLDVPIPLALTQGTSGKSGPKLARECLGGIYKLLKTAPPEHSLIYNKMKGEE